MKHIFAGAVMAILLVPSFAFAQVETPVTQSEVQTLIAELQSQLQTLLMQYVALLQAQLDAHTEEIKTIKGDTSASNSIGGGDTEEDVFDVYVNIEATLREDSWSGPNGDVTCTVVEVTTEDDYDVGLIKIRDKNGNLRLDAGKLDAKVCLEEGLYSWEAKIYKDADWNPSEQRYEGGQQLVKTGRFSI